MINIKIMQNTEIKLLLSELVASNIVSGTEGSDKKKEMFETPNGIFFKGVNIFGKVNKKFDGDDKGGIPSITIFDEFGENEIRARPRKFDVDIVQKIKGILPAEMVQIHGLYSQGEKDGKKWKSVDILSIHIIPNDKVEKYRDLWYLQLLAQRSHPLPTSSYAYTVAQKYSLPLSVEGDNFRIDITKMKKPTALVIDEEKKEKKENKIEKPSKKTTKSTEEKTKVESMKEEDPKKSETFKLRIMQILKEKKITVKKMAEELGSTVQEITPLMISLRKEFQKSIKMQFREGDTIFWFEETKP